MPNDREFHSSKRPSVVTHSPPSTQPDKRAKKNEPIGLMADWKKKVGQKGEVFKCSTLRTRDKRQTLRL